MAENKVMTVARRRAPGCRVLLVEDSDNCAATMELALSGIPGLSLLRAASAIHALQILNQQACDVQAIITDLNMPCMDGFELIRRIREDGRISHVPIIVVSADTDPTTPERIAGMNVDAFFAKPYSPAQVRRTLEQLLHVSAD